MFYEKPKNLRKFLPSIITLGLFATFLVINLFTGNYGFVGEPLRVFLLVGGACAGLVLIDNEKFHKILLAILAFYTAISLSEYKIFNAGILFNAYNGFYAFTLIFEDLIALGIMGIVVMYILKLIIKKDVFDKIINILLFAVAATMLLNFILESIGAIIAINDNDPYHYNNLYHSVLATIVFLPVIAYFFFNLDEIGVKCFIKFNKTSSKKEEPKKEITTEEKVPEEEAKPSEE